MHAPALRAVALRAMRRSLPGAARAALPVLLVGLAVAAPAARAAVPIMPLSEVRAGMQCVGSTVRQGLEPESFNAEVLSVYGGTDPDEAMIVMRFSGPLVADGGMAEGDSGSPVSCPDGAGTSKLIGAFAFGIGQYDNLIGGVTPIEAMLAMPTIGEAPAAPAIGTPSTVATQVKATKAGRAKQSSTARPAGAKVTSTTRQVAQGAVRESPMTYTLNGLRGPLAARFTAAAAAAGTSLRTAPAAPRAARVAPAGGLKAGDAVAATAVTGDVTYSAIGTVTYVDGDRIYAFGHPFNGVGASRLIMERATINALVSSPTIGEQASYKLGEPVGPVGTVGFDGSFGIGGLVGAAPPTITAGVTVRDAAGQLLRTGAVQIADERAVRGGFSAQLVPLGAAAGASGALQRVTRQSAVGGAAHTCTTIFLKGQPVPLYQCADSIIAVPSADTGGVETGVADAVAASVSLATSAERFLRLIDRLNVTVTLRHEADDAQIVRVRQPKNVKAGSVATVRVVVIQGSTGERREIPLKLRIPKAAAGQPTGIVVLANSVTDTSTSSDSTDPLAELFGTDESPVVAPKSLPALRKQFTGDGVSGLRALVVPGLTGAALRAALNGNGDDAGLTDAEVSALQSRVKIVQALPSVALSGQASTTVRPR